MKRIVLVAMVAVLALALAGCASQASSSSAASSSAASASSSEASSSSSSASQSASVANWVDVKTADEAAKGAGFASFGVMKSITLDGKEFKDPKFAYADGVAQATYENGAIALIVRKADGKHTATLTDRDKTEFAQTWPKSYEGLDVTCYGTAKGAATVLTWTDGTKEYGVTYQGLGGEEVSLDSDEVGAVVKAIKEADSSKDDSSKSAESSNLCTVPNVVGMSAADAAAAIEAAGLSPDGNNEGTVVDQEPNAGAQLEPGDTVSISTEGSTAANAVTVPDVVGMSAADAGAAIEAAGLSPDGDTEGTVVSQAPAPGVKLDPGDTVSISTEGTSSADGIIVPNVIGMEAGSAGATIEEAGLSPDGQTTGTVVGQSPEAGTVLDPGDTVSIKTDADE